MPIETGPRPGERLFRELGEAARALSFTDRMRLLGALKDPGGHFTELPDHLREAFARVELAVRR